MKYKKSTLSPFCLTEMPYINILHEWAKKEDISVIQNTEKIHLFLKKRKRATVFDSTRTYCVLSPRFSIFCSNLWIIWDYWRILVRIYGLSTFAVLSCSWISSFFIFFLFFSLLLVDLSLIASLGAILNSRLSPLESFLQYSSTQFLYFIAFSGLVHRSNIRYRYRLL